MKSSRYTTLSKSRGFIALSTTLIISVVVLTVATTVTLLSINSAQSTLAIIKGEESLILVEGCAEDALASAQASADYNGGTISRPEGSCVVAITKNGTSWQMVVSNVETKYQRTITIDLIRSTEITVTGWSYN